MKIAGIVLAAGKGTRMKSELPKVLHSVLGKKLIHYATDVISDFEHKYVVVGHEADLVSNELAKDITPVLQSTQNGTGHAVATVIAHEHFNQFNHEYVVVIPGDVPLINKDSLHQLINEVKNKNASLGFFSSVSSNPFGYGRVVRDGESISIVEEKDCSDEQRKINEINSGIYCFNADFLQSNINQLTNANAQGEIYLTDLIGIANNQKLDMVIVQVEEHSIQGINSMSQLNEVEDNLQKKLIQQFMDNGVYFQDPATTYLDESVTIASGSKIFANTHLKGDTSIGENCTIGPNTQISDSKIGSNTTVFNSVVDKSTVQANGSIGPFAHLRPGSELSENVKVGAFAETKNSKIGPGSKVPHLAYVGDAELGENVNFSAGAITVNYDGANKHQTKIEDGAFIGSDVMLVAPVVIGKDAMIGAGSVITKDVPEKALGIERNNQKNIEGYMDRKKKK